MNNTTTCEELYVTKKFKILIGLRCTLALLSCVFIMSMLSIIILFKKYRFFTQRLVLYLAISALSYQIVTMLDFTALHAYSSTSALNYCRLIGFLTLITFWWSIMSMVIIMTDIFIKVVYDKQTEHFEVIYVLVIFVLPILFDWIPFIQLSYGPVGYVCGIRNRTIDDCSPFQLGVILQFILFHIPAYILLGLVVILLSIALCFIRRQKNKFTGQYDPHAKNLKKKMETEIQPLLYYPFIFIVANIVPLFFTIYSAVEPEDTASIFYIGIVATVVYRLQGILITLAFTLDPETRKKLNRTELKAALKRFCYRDKNTPEYPLEFSRSDSMFGSTFDSKVSNYEEMVDEELAK